MKKTAVITGASRGIGRAAALLFAENGYDLALCCRHNANLLQQTANQARQLGAVCLTYTGDMGDPDSCAGFFKEIDDTFSSIDVLINNAGISITGLFQNMTQEEWQRILSSNLGSVFYLSQQAVRRITDAFHSQDKPVYIYANNPAETRAHLAAGIDGVANSLNSVVMVEAYRNIVAAIRG